MTDSRAINSLLDQAFCKTQHPKGPETVSYLSSSQYGTIISGNIQHHTAPIHLSVLGYGVTILHHHHQQSWPFVTGWGQTRAILLHMQGNDMIL